MTWQPIKTAPKDGTVVDLWVRPYTGRADRIVDMWWANGIGWRGPVRSEIREELARNATHWMPLPDAPDAAPQEK